MKNVFFKIFPLLLLYVVSGIVSAQTPSEMKIDAAARTQVIENLLKSLNESYVFPETAKKMEENLRERLKNKEYEQITDGAAFAQKLTEDLQSVSKDKHLRVRFSGRVLPKFALNVEPSAEQIAEQKLMQQLNNSGFVKVENMRGNIGYIDLRGFMNADFGEETVAAAMNFVANSDALIFDLRQNGGGDPKMVALISSYLFGDKPVHLNSLYWRPGNRTDEFWTKPAVSGKNSAINPSMF